MVHMWKFHRGHLAGKLALVLGSRLAVTATEDVLMYDLWVEGEQVEFSERALFELATCIVTDEE